MTHGIGIDFGTTNSAVARARGDEVQVARFALDGDLRDVFRSLLFFENDRDWVDGMPPAWCGPEAIENYIESEADGRLMQSMKSFLAVRSFQATRVFGREMRLEQLIAAVIKDLARQAGAAFDPNKAVVAAGRPVKFAYATEADDHDFAERRLRKAFALAGVSNVTFVPEPLAAALQYESTLSGDEVVLVADFGGGTSDFSLLRLGPSHAHELAGPNRIIGTGGVGVAGDNLDARLIQHVVAPALGKGTKYRSMTGDECHLPAWIFRKLKRWHELSVLKSERNMNMLNQYARTALAPERVRALIDVVEYDAGYALYQAVERTKIGLTAEESARLRFSAGAAEVDEIVRRDQFETWIAPDLADIDGAVEELLTRTQIKSGDVDTVFLTGGTAQVPAVRRLFETRFGADRLRASNYLSSVAAGLARFAQRLS